METAWCNLCLVRRITKDINYNSSRIKFNRHMSSEALRTPSLGLDPATLALLSLSLGLSLAPPFSATRLSPIARTFLS
jgi:hypothetical protein